MARPSKYSGLSDYLLEISEKFRDTGEERFILDFKTIEALWIKLPASAYNHLAWWYHKNYTRLWEKAGFRFENVDLKAKSVTFEYRGGFSEAGKAARRTDEREKKKAKLKRAEQEAENSPYPFLRRLNRKEANQLRKELGMTDNDNSLPGMNEERPPYADHSPDGAICRHPIYGALKGLIRIPPGLDLTEPADPEWGERVWGEETM